MMVGASSHSQTEREQHDYYATEPIALEKFLDAYVKRDGCILRQNIWEPVYTVLVKKHSTCGVLYKQW